MCFCLFPAAATADLELEPTKSTTASNFKAFVVRAFHARDEDNDGSVMVGHCSSGCWGSWSWSCREYVYVCDGTDLFIVYINSIYGSSFFGFFSSHWVIVGLPPVLVSSTSLCLTQQQSRHSWSTSPLTNSKKRPGQNSII